MLTEFFVVAVAFASIVTFAVLVVALNRMQKDHVRHMSELDY